MPERGQLCGDCSQATPLPVLGDLALSELAERNGAAERNHPDCSPQNTPMCGAENTRSRDGRGLFPIEQVENS
jgi:hypothetical protein